MASSLAREAPASRHLRARPISVNYTGPDSYTITAADRATAISLARALASYTNNSTSTTC